MQNEKCKNLIILIVGEILWVENFFFNGYLCETNLWLVKDNVVYFFNIVFCGMVMVVLVLCMFLDMLCEYYKEELVQYQEGVLDIIQ